MKYMVITMPMILVFDTVGISLSSHLGLLIRDQITWGAWVAQMVERLPMAQVMIPGSWD